MRELVKIIEVDGVLTSHVLRVANSAAFARPVPVATIDRALPLLGERLVIGIALGVCAVQLYEDPLDGYASERGALWRHSLRCAIAAREIAPFCRTEVFPDLAFTAGIVHDLGKAVLSSYLESASAEITSSLDKGVFTDYLDAERETLGTDHAEVGAAVGSRWNLPPALIRVMQHHHLPSGADEAFRPLLYAVHLGDFAAMMAGIGTGADTMVYNIDQHYKDYVKISGKELERVMLRTGDEYERIVAATFDAQEKQA